ncbi:hypothetical protein N7481_001234 [Penicillium waksmanii]|uniref:uncharacterized protein n=1 Tax=Penicillium waksmanii TaxID=69791 RepID=UPI002547A888|nr:uncharacterized protein N7481_001234 [Penicillium waksmanii]KAJ6000825.1 hypothetical protein N7481_001234 [Penicillium waksmanii]
MARSRTVRAPTTASLPNNLRIPSTTPSLSKTLGKLSRPALLDLAISWLGDRNVESFPPYLQPSDTNNHDNEETLPYPAAETLAEVREAYIDLRDRRGGKQEIIERILEGDWRHGITLRQLAMADLRYMDDRPASLRWTAMELVRLNDDGTSKSKRTRDTISIASEDWSANIPRIQAASFVKSLHAEIAPLIKAHYHLSRSSTLPLTFLRIFIIDSPYQTPRQQPEIFTDATRIIYIAFPDSCPYFYTSSITSSNASDSSSGSGSLATDPRTLQRLVREAIPKALSRPHQRFTLKPTALAAKNLQTLLTLRGPGRSTSSNGVFSIFADAALEGSPLDPRPSNTVLAEEHMRGRESVSSMHDDKENHTHGHNDASKSARPANKKRPSGSGTAAMTDGALSPDSKKRRLAVESRFGTVGCSVTPAPLDRLDIRLLDTPVAEGNADADADRNAANLAPAVSLTFTGSDVIGGIRKLAELGVVDPERMPSWMTGEDAVSTAFVRGGKRLHVERG